MQHWQAGFEKMEVTGRFELPEELLDLERNGLLESAAFDKNRAHRTVSTAPSPPLAGHDPPSRTTSAQGDYGLYDESSRWASYLSNSIPYFYFGTVCSAVHRRVCPVSVSPCVQAGLQLESHVSLASCVQLL